MEDFLRTQLHPAEFCAVCTEPFSLRHQPVALPCKHIFGHKCIKKWLLEGRGNTAACPTCRHVVVRRQMIYPSFDVPTVWKAVCKLPPERLSSLMLEMWSGVRKLWRLKANGEFTITEMHDEAIIPALLKVADRDPILDCYNLLATTWDSMDRADIAIGLSVPFVRLVRLMSSASSILPRYMTSAANINELLWKANTCIGLEKENVSWNMIMEAGNLQSSRYVPLLHAYTMLLSQGIAYSPQPNPWPSRRHEIMNLVVERCCRKIASDRWEGWPTSNLKDMLVVVYEELRRHHTDKYRISLSGLEGEENFVMGIWTLAVWNAKKVQLH